MSFKRISIRQQKELEDIKSKYDLFLLLIISFILAIFSWAFIYNMKSYSVNKYFITESSGWDIFLLIGNIILILFFVTKFFESLIGYFFVLIVKRYGKKLKIEKIKKHTNNFFVWELALSSLGKFEYVLVKDHLIKLSTDGKHSSQRAMAIYELGKFKDLNMLSFIKDRTKELQDNEWKFYYLMAQMMIGGLEELTAISELQKMKSEDELYPGEEFVFNDYCRVLITSEINVLFRKLSKDTNEKRIDINEELFLKFKEKIEPVLDEINIDNQIINSDEEI